MASAPLVLPSNPADAIAALQSTPPVAKVLSPLPAFTLVCGVLGGCPSDLFVLSGGQTNG
eukprot:506690-Rhodomonas_salina.1